MLKRKEVAKKLNASDKSVWRWIKQGRIKAVKIGQQYKVEESEVEYVRTHGLREPNITHSN